MVAGICKSQLLWNLRQENHLNPGRGGCSEQRLCHCTVALGTRVRLRLKKNTKNSSHKSDSPSVSLLQSMAPPSSTRAINTFPFTLHIQLLPMAVASALQRHLICVHLLPPPLPPPSSRPLPLMLCRVAWSPGSLGLLSFSTCFYPILYTESIMMI